MPETFMDHVIYMVILLLKIVAVVLPLILAVAYYTYAERKVIGYMQIRRGPNRIGPLGLFQPFADVFKLLLKEIIEPGIGLERGFDVWSGADGEWDPASIPLARAREWLAAREEEVGWIPQRPA